MTILYSDRDIAVCIKPVGLDSEAEVPAKLKELLGGEISASGLPFRELSWTCI